MTNKLTYARVTTKAKNTRRAPGMWEYKLSDNSYIIFKRDQLQIGSWYFFEFSEDTLGNHTYVSHAEVDEQQAVNFEEEIRSAKALTYTVVNIWEKLEASQRQLLMREFGIAAGILTTASLTWGGITAIAAEEALLGTLTGGLSLIAAAGVGIFTALQYEERKNHLSNYQSLFNEYMKQRNFMAREAAAFIPKQYRYLDFAHPEIESMVSKARHMINNINLSNVFSIGNDELTFSGVTA